MASRASADEQKKALQDRIRERARKELQLDSVADYNVGVCGLSGTGKSSLINSIRGIQPNAKNAAPVGVTECTDKIDKYDFDDMPRLKLWDVPGAGTVKHPAEHYFEQKFLFLFDYLLIVIGNQLTEYDIYFAQKAVQHKMQFAFVRSKSDQSIQEILFQVKGIGRHQVATEAERKYAAKQLQEQVNKDMKIQLSSKKAYDPLKKIPLYIVSAWAFLDTKLYPMDEKKLVQEVLSRMITDRNQS